MMAVGDWPTIFTEKVMSDYAATAARRDAELLKLARDMSNATAQEREKYNAAFHAAQQAAANKA